MSPCPRVHRRRSRWPDTTAPVVTGFAIPSGSNSTTVTISNFTATDNVAVTGFLLTETSTIPSATAAGWSSTKPASYTFSSPGNKALYAWAKDAAGNIAVPLSAQTTITLPDAIAPVITGFGLAPTSNSLTVPIMTLTATDNLGVAGYLLTETSTAPSASTAGWTASAPTSYTFSSASPHTLYAWAKDAAGNISASVSSSTLIAMPDMTPPVVTGFIVPLNSASLTVSITSLAASDNVSVTGYLVTESSATPSASAAGWSATAPASYTVGSTGSKTLYAWAKDEAGNISAAYNATVTVSASSDAGVPTITRFVMPSASTRLTVAVTSFTATDDVGVTGYLVTERSSRPRLSSSRWRSTPPTSYTFSSTGTRTLYAWVKDASGNLSKSSRAVVVVNYRGNPYPDESHDELERE